MILVYTYYSCPWKIQTGDDIRIHTICKALTNMGKNIIVFNLSHLAEKYDINKEDSVIYVSVPRKIYRFFAKLLKWKSQHDLNPLIKITHYIDEFVIAIKLLQIARRQKVIYVFGSMTIFSLFARILGIKAKIIYDPLANYAQTLYLWSRSSIKELFRYGLYLILHNLQLKASNSIVYPSQYDLRNAKRMFKVRNAYIIPNPFPICYESFEKYLLLRLQREEFNKPYFVLLAGGRSKGNEEAVKLTIKVFNDIPPDRFRLFITGPWQDMKKYAKNPSIEILGVLPHEKLKELLAISDYGLSPIFSHVAGTFLKVLGYIAAGLDIIVSPPSLIGIDIETLKKAKIRVYIIPNREKYHEIIHRLVNEYHYNVSRKKPFICTSQPIPVLNSILSD